MVLIVGLFSPQSDKSGDQGSGIRADEGDPRLMPRESAHWEATNPNGAPLLVSALFVWGLQQF